MIRFVFLAVLLYLSPAHADTIPQIKNCYDTTSSNVASSICLEKELDNLNQKMEEAYKVALNHALDHDEIGKTIFGNVKPEDTNVAYLERSQKQFINYRETECTRKRVAMDIGSMAGHAQQGCEIKLTLQRLEELDPYNEVKDKK